MCTNCGQINNVYCQSGNIFCDMCQPLTPMHRESIRRYYNYLNDYCFWCGMIKSNNCDCSLRPEEQLNHIYYLQIAKKYKEIIDYKSKNKPPKCVWCNQFNIIDCDCNYCTFEEKVRRYKLRNNPEQLKNYILFPKCKRCYSPLINNRCNECFKICNRLFEISKLYKLGWDANYIYQYFVNKKILIFSKHF
jgi:hypothetical protein